MEKEELVVLKEEIIVNHSGAILKAKMFDEGRLLATFSSDGEVHIYQKKQSKWSHQSCLKLFECPVVASDIDINLGRWELAVVSFSGSVKICRLEQNLELIVSHHLNLKLGSIIVCCLWGTQVSQLLITTEDGSLGVIDLISNRHQITRIGSKSQTLPLIIKKGNNGIVYLSEGCQISKMSSIQIGLSFSLQSVLLVKDPIVDFQVSNCDIFNNLVVLTQKSILFYLLDQNQAILTTSYSIDRNVICSKLGWGIKFEEIGLYECLNGAINTRWFCKNLVGKWFQEKIDANSEDQIQKTRV